MREEQRLFLVQARSAFDVYELLRANESVHPCHALHYLQMATELLGKAHAWKNGPVSKSHKSLVQFLRNLSSNSKAQKALNYGDQNDSWTQTIRKIIPIADALQRLAPALAIDGPNPEYPWPPASPAVAPVEFQFPIWEELTTAAFGRRFVSILEYLFREAESYL